MAISNKEHDGRKRPRPDLVQRNKERATHGLSGSPTMKTWEAMIRRCTKEKDKDFARYGGRGIKVCDRWLNSFEDFVSDMGVKPDGTSLDRIDNNKGYSLDNCRWETVVNQNNNRRSNKHISFDGRSQTVAEWAREIGIGPKTLSYRLKSGWSIEDAIKMSVDHSNRRAA